MTRCKVRWRSVSVAISALAMMAATLAHTSPIDPTEATWTDDVYANASLSAGPNTGVNFARSLGAYGEFVRDFSVLGNTVTMPGYQAYRTTGDSPITLDSPQGFSSESALLALPFRMTGRSCARAERPTGTECAFSNSAISSALTDVDSFRVHATNPFSIPTTPLVVYSPALSTNPLRVTASCDPGTVGNTGLTGSGDFTLGSGSNTRYLSLPTKEAPRRQQIRTASGYTYRVALLYTEARALNFARAQVAINIQTTDLIGNDSWSINAILAMAECGNSMSAPALPPRPTHANPAVVWDPDFVIQNSDATAPLMASLPELDATAVAADPPESNVGADGEAGPTAATTPTDPSSATTGQSSITSRSRTSTVPRDPAASPRSSTSAPTTTATSKRTFTAPKTATTTSTSPTITIPTQPGTLSATAQTQTVGTVEADGTELDVVVKGATVPSDAPTALPALDTWINEGTRPSGVWRTLASSDPDSDGWRWAAVNRETGTVVYVR